MEQEFIEILHIGGHNPILRKQTDKVIDAFLSASKKREDINLTVTTIGKIPDKYKNIGNKRLKIVRGELSEDEIQDMFLKCDYIIQVPTHEGLGLDFYEAVKYGKPVVTLDAPPNNEVITVSNGWLLKCKSISNVDNAYGITKSYTFKTSDLENLIEQITKKQVKEKSDFINRSLITKNSLEYLHELYIALNSNSNSNKGFKKPIIESINIKRRHKFLRLIFALTYIFLRKQSYIEHYLDLRNKVKKLILKIESLWY